jgi:beta-glucosidase
MNNKGNVFVCMGLLFITIIAASKPWEAEGRTDGAWLSFHQAYVEQANRAASSNPEFMKAIFYGDSITQNLAVEGLNVWNMYYQLRNTFDNGLEGDRTQQVLWRIRNGELIGLKPKLIILMIGTNNIDDGATPDEIAVGVQTICQELRNQLPNTRILLLGILPRSGGASISDAVAQINSKLINLDDGYWIRFLNMISAFEISHTQVKPELYKDDRHLTPAGYEVWYMSMESWFAEMIE